MVGAHGVDSDGEESSPGHANACALCARSCEIEVPCLAHEVPLRSGNNCRSSFVCYRGIALPALGAFLSHRTRLAFQLAGELTHAQLGYPSLRYSRPLNQQLVGGSDDLR